MPKGNKIDVDGIVLELRPGAKFKVKIIDPNFPENHMVQGHISGKMRMNFIRIIPGDRVKIELDANDPTKGRITFRY